MPLRDSEKRKKYHARYMKEVWYPRNKEKHVGYVKRLKQRAARFIEEYKKERQCADCGYSGKEFPQVLDFDHVKQKGMKKFTLGSWSHTVLSTKTIMREMQKCDLVCANCHRIRTFLRGRSERHSIKK